MSNILWEKYRQTQKSGVSPNAKHKQLIFIAADAIGKKRQSRC